MHATTSHVHHTESRARACFTYAHSCITCLPDVLLPVAAGQACLLLDALERPRRLGRLDARRDQGVATGYLCRRRVLDADRLRLGASRDRCGDAGPRRPGRAVRLDLHRQGLRHGSDHHRRQCVPRLGRRGRWGSSRGAEREHSGSRTCRRYLRQLRAGAFRSHLPEDVGDFLRDACGRPRHHNAALTAGAALAAADARRTAAVAAAGHGDAASQPGRGTTHARRRRRRVHHGADSRVGDDPRAKLRRPCVGGPLCG